jgi:ABC-type molybdate transport system substrate-binding protein
MVFERIEQQGRRGAFKQLADKSLQLTGGPNSPPPPAGRNVYAELVAQGRADVFITYCTNATVARAEQPSLRAVAVPQAINVSADYGVAPVRGAGPQARRFIDYLLSPGAQAILVRRGFAPP